MLAPDCRGRGRGRTIGCTEPTVADRTDIDTAATTVISMVVRTTYEAGIDDNTKHSKVGPTWDVQSKFDDHIVQASVEVVSSPVGNVPGRITEVEKEA